jgi:hypothetical protein
MSKLGLERISTNWDKKGTKLERRKIEEINQFGL